MAPLKQPDQLHGPRSMGRVSTREDACRLWPVPCSDANARRCLIQRLCIRPIRYSRSLPAHLSPIFTGTSTLACGHAPTRSLWTSHLLGVAQSCMLVLAPKTTSHKKLVKFPFAPVIIYASVADLPNRSSLSPCLDFGLAHR